MKEITQYLFTVIIFISLMIFSSCKKESPSEYEKDIDLVEVYDDTSIALPVTVTAGHNCLLAAYTTNSGRLKFMLTDNEGKLRWQREIGVHSISAILKGPNETFTIFSDFRFVVIDINGNVLKDALIFSSSPHFFERATIFHAQINKNNNYLLCGVANTGPSQRNHAFAAEFTQNGDSVFLRYYIDTVMPPHPISIGNYSVISGCEETDDGGYILLGSRYGYFDNLDNRIYYSIIRTDNTGKVIWEKYNLLVDSQYIPRPAATAPFSDQFYFNTDIYGFHPQSYTHEILRTADGNYLFFLNNPNYSASNQGARVYKIDPNGNIIDSTFINVGRFNRFTGGLANSYKISSSKISYSCGNGVVRNSDNTFSICMQNGFFGSKGLTTSYIGESRSFVVRMDQDLNVLNTQYLQNYYSDCFSSICKSSDGRTAYFGLISSFGKSYKPALILSNDN